MEGEAAAAILQVLVRNLIDHSKKEISLIRGLDKEAAKLAGSLDTIQQFLNDAEMRTIPGGAVKSWLKKLEDVAFDADNVLDELNYHLLSKQIKPTKPMREKVVSCFSSFSHIARPRNMALKIQEINENLESIQTEAARLGLVERLATDVPTLPDAAFETDAFTVDPIFIGRDEVMLKIVEILTASITSDERLISILAIVGMGGLGKTTLTRKVFHHLNKETHFRSHIWVHVSRNFDPIVLFKKIVKELTSKDEVGSRQDILKKLQEALKDKTYLLVLDDAWNEDPLKWEDFINSLIGVTSLKGNAIIVTTRITEVASIVSPHHTEVLKGLSDEDCWSIIKEKTFGKEDSPSEFEGIGRKIAKRCEGLPLAANVVSGVLRNKSEEKWLSIEQKWLSRDDGRNIRKILRLSFDNLSPPPLKKCFAYCSVFPKGRRIVKQKLIEYWMAEGFLEADGSNEMESMGDNFFNILLRNSLLQVSRRDYYGNVRESVMHDLVHDLACSVLGSSDDVDGSMSRVRYMTHEGESSPIPKQVAKYLRTLLYEGEIYGNMFSDLGCLHVLTLDDDQVKELPDSIRKLIHLRVLDLNGSEMEYLPDWIGELFHLQTLRAETGYMRQLPSTLKYLINLRHLYIDLETELPAEIGRLTSLRTLSHFPVGDRTGYKIEELGSLKYLKGKLAIENLERVHSKEEAEKASLSKKSKILELRLVWNYIQREGETTNDENVLEGLQPHSDLKKLAIEGFKGKRFPLWTLKMAVGNVGPGSWVPLNKLIEIILYNCSECEEIPMFGQLPNLKFLYLGELSNVKCINSSFYGLVNEETRTVFPALERLELSEMPKLAEWAQVEFGGATEVKVFPHLQHLVMTYCKQLTSFPDHFSSCLKSLIIVGIGSYKPLANILQTKLTLLTELCLRGIDDLEYLPNRLFYNIPNLSTLEIGKFAKLRGLPDGLWTINSLEYLIIRECPYLERIANTGVEQSQGGSLTSLRRLEIRECHALLYLPCEMVGSSLEKLMLENLSILKNLAGIIDCLPKSPRLTHLEIVGFPEFMATCCVEFSPFCSLSMLSIDVSMWGSLMESVDGILQGCCHSLVILELKGTEGWENVPGSIQHLTALPRLKLSSFGMEELPEWLGNLSSLRWLDIYNCKKLRRLPSVDAMRRLTKLTYLEITGCPELRIQQPSDAADSQWPNNCDIRIDYIKYKVETTRKHTCLMSGFL